MARRSVLASLIESMKANEKFVNDEDTKPANIDQLPAMCGPASLKSALEKYGFEIELEELADICETSDEFGTPPKNLVTAAKKLGFKAKMEVDSNFDRLRELFDADIVPIVDWWKDDDGHYSVVSDINDTEIQIMDPETGEKKWITIEEFEPLWFDFEIGDPDHKKPINKCVIFVEDGPRTHKTPTFKGALKLKFNVNARVTR